MKKSIESEVIIEEEKKRIREMPFPLVPVIRSVITSIVGIALIKSK